MSHILKNRVLLAAACLVTCVAVGSSLYRLSQSPWIELASFAFLLFVMVLTQQVLLRHSEAVRWGRRSFADALIFFTVMSLGAAPAILLAAADAALCFRRDDREPAGLLKLIPTFLAFAAGAMIYALTVYVLRTLFNTEAPGASSAATPLGVLLFPLCLMVAAQIFIQFVIARLCGVDGDSAAVSLDERESAIKIALTRTNALTRWAGGAAAILAYASLKGESLVFLPLGAFIILLVHLLNRFNEQRVGEIEMREGEKVRHIEEMATLHINTIESLAIAIDAKDQTTSGHVRRTQIYAMEMGRYLELSAGEMKALEAGALLHDVGKLAVPEYILNKPGKLTAAEFDKMKVHTNVGGDIIRRVGFPYPVEDIVRYHHEKWDGSGYPRGLRAEQIPVVARIIAVVDFYDATRCDRPYRRGMTRDQSLQLIRSMAGTSFDPRVVDTFIEHIEVLDKLIAEHDINEQVAAASTDMTASAPDAGLAADMLGDPSSELGHKSIVAAQREVFALHQIAQTVGASLNLQDTVTLIAGKLSAIVPFDTCIIYLTDEQTGKATAVHVSGANAECYRGRRITLGEGVSGWVIANGRSMCNTPPELDLVGVKEDAARKVRALLSSPLPGECGTFGAITLLAEHRGSYTSEHVRLLESVALHAAVALGNALTFERTRDSALSDVLTGMPNARALRFMLDQRIAESERLNHEALAVIAINLTGFQKINDTHGRGVGDRIMVEAAKLVRMQFRQMDVVSRYAGDEFIALMPMASRDVARLVVERIEASFATHDFVVRHAHTVRIGVNTGIACYPEDATHTEDLLACAERRLLDAKHISRIDPNIDNSYVNAGFGIAR